MSRFPALISLVSLFFGDVSAELPMKSINQLCPALTFDHEMIPHGDTTVVSFVPDKKMEKFDFVDVHLMKGDKQLNVPLQNLGNGIWQATLNMEFHPMMKYSFTYCLKKLSPVDCNTEHFKPTNFREIKQQDYIAVEVEREPVYAFYETIETSNKLKENEMFMKMMTEINHLKKLLLEEKEKMQMLLSNQNSMLESGVYMERVWMFLKELKADVLTCKSEQDQIKNQLFNELQNLSQRLEQCCAASSKKMMYQPAPRVQTEPIALKKVASHQSLVTGSSGMAEMRLPSVSYAGQTQPIVSRYYQGSSSLEARPKAVQYIQSSSSQ